MRSSMPDFDRYDVGRLRRDPRGPWSSCRYHTRGSVVAAGHIIYTDLGVASGVQPGDVLTVFRDSPDARTCRASDGRPGGRADRRAVETSSAKLTTSARESMLGRRSRDRALERVPFAVVTENKTAGPRARRFLFRVQLVPGASASSGHEAVGVVAVGRHRGRRLRPAGDPADRFGGRRSAVPVSGPTAASRSARTHHGLTSSGPILPPHQPPDLPCSRRTARVTAGPAGGVDVDDLDHRLVTLVKHVADLSDNPLLGDLGDVQQPLDARAGSR